jgi:hypothetical protein
MTDRKDPRLDDRHEVQPSAGGGTGSGAGERTGEHDPGPLGGTDMRSGAARAGGSSGVASGLQHAGMKPSSAGLGGVGEVGTAGGSTGPEAGKGGEAGTRGSK